MASVTPNAVSSLDARARPIVSGNSDLSSSTVDGEKAAKKLPPIKAPVGLAPSPDLKNCKSKVGSLHNIKHTPAGGAVTIPTQKLKWNAKSKVGSLENKEHKPAGGALKIESRKLEWKATSKVQSLANANHKPGGGKVKIFNESYREKSANSRTKELAKSEAEQDVQLDEQKSTRKPASKQTSGQSASKTNSLVHDLKGLNLKDK